MESTHRAHDRPLTSHNSSGIAVRADWRSRGRTRDQEPCFTCRDVQSDDLLLRSNVSFFDLRTPWQPVPPRSPSTFSSVSAYLVERFAP